MQWPNSEQEVEWTQFKQKLCQEFVPKNAEQALQRQFLGLSVTSTIRNFNDNFRELYNRQRLVAKVLDPIGGAITAQDDKFYVSNYILKLWNAADNERKKKLSGPIGKVYEAWITSSTLEEIKTGCKPEYTLEQVMYICESIEDSMMGAPIEENPTFPTLYVAVEGTYSGPMDLARIEATMNSLHTKLLDINRQDVKCHHCHLKGHFRRDCSERAKKIALKKEETKVVDKKPYIKKSEVQVVETSSGEDSDVSESSEN